VTTVRKIAAAQTTPLAGDVGANVAQHVRLAALAAEADARVLVFPELSLTGYEPGLARDLAFSDGDARLKPLVALARARSMTVIAGAPVTIGSGLHIGALIVGPDGALDVYTKHHLGAFSAGAAVDGEVPPPEDTVFDPGDRNPLVRLDGHTAAVAVCADTGRASHAQAAADRGAATYLASMFVIPSEFARETANLERYAARHSMAVVFANHGGPTGGLAAAGRSSIWSDRGELLARLDEAGAGVVVAVEHATGWSAEKRTLAT
jgi:predicted amidohydrolase